jgi:hypothetical protein
MLAASVGVAAVLEPSEVIWPGVGVAITATAVVTGAGDGLLSEVFGVGDEVRGGNGAAARSDETVAGMVVDSLTTMGGAVSESVTPTTSDADVRVARMTRKPAVNTIAVRGTNATKANANAVVGSDFDCLAMRNRYRLRRTNITPPAPERQKAPLVWSDGSRQNQKVVDLPSVARRNV